MSERHPNDHKRNLRLSSIHIIVFDTHTQSCVDSALGNQNGVPHIKNISLPSQEQLPLEEEAYDVSIEANLVYTGSPWPLRRFPVTHQVTL